MFPSAPHRHPRTSNERAIGEKKCWPTDQAGFYRQVWSLSTAAAGPLAASRTEDKAFIVEGDKSSAHLKARHQSRPLAGCAPQVSSVCPVGGGRVSGQRGRSPVGRWRAEQRVSTSMRRMCSGIFTHHSKLP